MNYRYQKPHPSLASFVRTVLILEDTDEQKPSELPLVTNGMPAVVRKGNKITLYASSADENNWNEECTAYFFMPFSIAPLFNIDIKKLMAEPVVFETDSPEDFLIKKLELNRRNCEIIRYSTDQIMFDPRPDVLPDILEKLGLNERTFQRIFKKFVGITSSNYRRICQFQQSFTQLRTNDFETMAAVAYENGFADQSHFIRSFKEFTETTPDNYLKTGLKKKK